MLSTIFSEPAASSDLIFQAGGNEKMFEQAILRLSSKMFPSYFCMEYKPRVQSRERKRHEPDLALIHKEFMDWYVIEVELSKHPFNSHIRPQLETLNPTNGANYSNPVHRDNQFRYRFENTSPYSYRKFERLSKETPPGLMCIIDEYKQDVFRYCIGHNIEYMVCKPYFNSVGLSALLVDDIPDNLARVFSQGSYVLQFKQRIGDNHQLLKLPINFPDTTGIKIDVGTGILALNVTISGNSQFITVDKNHLGETYQRHELTLLYNDVYTIIHD